MHPKDVGGILDSAKHAEWLSGGSTPTLTEGRARGKNWGSRCASWAHSRGWCTSWWGYKRWFSWKYSEPRAKKKWNVPSRALILERGRNSGNEQRSRSGKNFCPNESTGPYSQGSTQVSCAILTPHPMSSCKAFVRETPAPKSAISFPHLFSATILSEIRSFNLARCGTLWPRVVRWNCGEFPNERMEREELRN